MFSTAASRAMPALLEDSDFDEVQDADCFNSYPDEDNFYEIPARLDVRSKRVTVGHCSPLLRDAYEERIASIDVEGDGDRNTDHHTFNNRMLLSVKNGHNNNRSARTCATRGSGRSSPLSSSSRESSGGASLLEMVSINDEDALPTLSSLIRADLTSTKNRRSLPPAQRINNHGSVAKPELRGSERVRARNAADNARPTTNKDKTLSSEEVVHTPLPAVNYPLPTPARASDAGASYPDLFDSTSRFLNSIKRQAYVSQDQLPSDVLD
ncbi:hypothetical protein KCU64_g1829, partial [Aureobasidium melanogenum]